MTTVEDSTLEEDRAQAHVHGLLQELRDVETDFRRCYARMLAVVTELEAQQAGPVTGFGTTTRLVAGVLNLSTSEAKARVEQAQLLTPRHSLTGELLPPALPPTATELAAGAIGSAHVKVITATLRQIPPTTPPEVFAQAEETLARGEAVRPRRADPDRGAPARPPQPRRQRTHRRA